MVSSHYGKDCVEEVLDSVRNGSSQGGRVHISEVLDVVRNGSSHYGRDPRVSET